MEILYAIIGTLVISVIVTLILADMYYKDKMEDCKRIADEKYSKIYLRKEDSLKSYYEDLLTKEQEKCKQSILTVIEKYDKRVKEINDMSNREVEIVKILMKHLQHKG